MDIPTPVRGAMFVRSNMMAHKSIHLTILVIFYIMYVHNMKTLSLITAYFPQSPSFPSLSTIPSPRQKT